MITTVLISMLTFFAPKQGDWSELKSLKLYPVIEVQAFDKLTDEKIFAMPFKEADVSQLKPVLGRATTEKERLIWKSVGRLAVATFADGSSSRILINEHAAFLFDTQHKTNYIISDKDRKVWETLIIKYAPDKK